MRKQKLLSKRLYKKYVFAVIATAACLYGQYLMLPVFGAMQYFLLFPLVFIAAALGGFGPALVVIGMGGVGAHVLLADPAARMGLHYPSWLALIKFFIFAFSTLVGSWIVHLIQEKQQFLLKNIDVLRESDKQFKMLADTSPVLIWMTNLEKNTTWFNKGWQVFTGLSLDECLSLNIESLIHPDDLHVVLTTFNKSFDQREEFRIEYRLRNAEGIYRWVLCNSVPMYNGDEFCGYIGVCVDINDHKESEEKIKKALFSRDQFLAVASHELKTPIASLTLQAQVFKKMMEKNNDEIPKDKVLMISDQMTRSAMRLTKLIDDVLDNSRINSGKFHMNPEECDLTEIVESVINNLKIQFANAKTGSPVIDYKTDLHDVDAYKGTWDRIKIEQVLTNLITNALKYGNKQPIQVSIKSLGDKVQFAVKDHGMGISPDHIDKIFNRFYQIISASSQGGLGIGLFISKQIVKAHEGSIFVQSELNKGSTFTVELPKNPINLKEGYNV